MRDGQLAGVEGLLNFVHEMGQAQTSVDVFLGAPDFLGERFHGVGIGLQLHEGGIASRLVEFVHVGALKVLNELQFETLRIGEFADARRDSLPACDTGGAVTPRSSHEFKETVLATRQRADENGLQDAVLADAGKFRQLRFVKRASWVCFRFGFWRAMRDV